jgi:hypothetical protein
MSSNFKYLGIGFAASIVLAIMLLASIIMAQRVTAQNNAQPTSTVIVFASPTLPPPTFTITPSFTPTASITPTPTPSNTPDPLETYLQNGTLQITGPLTREEQWTLYLSSLKFHAPTRSEALHLTREINQSTNGYPDNTCGPLAIAILRDADLLPQEIIPHDFWLLNPWVPADRLRLERDTFPTGRYKHVRFTRSIKNFDWVSFPLYPGDFVYLHAGSGGNFEHMLTVTRVDSANRAYSVTNYNTGDGFIITEALLYDPNDPAAGLFPQWTQKQFALLGSTGFGGFEVWRVNR